MIKQIKPSQIDLHLKYKCPNHKCNNYHWLSLKEVQTNNFKVVCEDCDTVFKPKTVSKFKILYKKSNKKSSKTINNIETNLPEALLNKCVTILNTYGFTNEESTALVMDAFKETGSNDVGVLIKQALLFLRNN